MVEKKTYFGGRLGPRACIVDINNMHVMERKERCEFHILVFLMATGYQCCAKKGEKKRKKNGRDLLPLQIIKPTRLVRPSHQLIARLLVCDYGTSYSSS